MPYPGYCISSRLKSLNLENIKKFEGETAEFVNAENL
jgi:hypothetical protein